MISVTRKEQFNAAHRLFNPDLTDEENDALFGKCANASGHGHNYELEVTITGDLDPRTGYVMDLKTLSDIIHKAVLSDLDHRNLNTDVPWLAGKIPTAEVIADAIWERLEPHLGSALSSVVVRETDKNSAHRVRS